MIGMKRLMFKARLGKDAPIQTVGFYEFAEGELEEYLLDYNSEKDLVQNMGSDWAYEAVHSDCLEYWAELEEV